METSELIFTIFALLVAMAGFLMLALLFYTGRTRVKQIDKIAYGFEFPNDSIFALVLRVPNYGGALLWKWYAKRIGLEGKINHFDRHFKWPFIASFLLALFIVFSTIVMALFQKYAGIE